MIPGKYCCTRFASSISIRLGIASLLGITTLTGCSREPELDFPPPPAPLQTHAVGPPSGRSRPPGSGLPV